MKIAYFHCFAGVSGDMILGALVDAGLKLKDLRAALAKLKLRGYTLAQKKVEKHHLGATRVMVRVTGHQHVHRCLPDITALIRKSGIEAEAKEQALAVFTRLARCEGKIHRMPYDRVHFHEVGAVDAIVDIVGAVVGLGLLGVEKVYASPLSLGTGTVHAAHGVLPVPAPATLELAKGYPVVRTQIPAELTTPTGAALITTLTGGYTPVPPCTVSRIGYGAGSRDLEQVPNLLRLELGDTAGTGFEEDEAYMIETNLDNMNPELFGYVTEKLLEEGAKDVYLTATQMKKGRPGTLLSVLAAPGHLHPLAETILRETSTLGVRYFPVKRKKLKRQVVRFKSSLGTVRVKQAWYQGTGRSAPEYEDCARIARGKKMSLWKVYNTVEKELADKR